MLEQVKKRPAVWGCWPMCEPIDENHAKHPKNSSSPLKSWGFLHLAAHSTSSNQAPPEQRCMRWLLGSTDLATAKMLLMHVAIILH